MQQLISIFDKLPQFGFERLLPLLGWFFLKLRLDVCLLLAVGLIDHFDGRRRRGVGSTADATGTAGTGPAATMTMTWPAYA